MCTIFTVHDRLAGHPMVIAANRDELVARPWSGPRRVEGDPVRVMPRDESAGGTWIGMNDRGLLLAVTNRLHRELAHSLPSRGILSQDALARYSIGDAAAHVRAAAAESPYNGFNMILAQDGEARLMSYGGGALHEIALGPGVHVVTSLHDLNPPHLSSLCDRVAAAAADAHGDLDRFAAGVREVLADHEPRGPMYSVCKHGDVFATRSAALLALRADGGLDFRFAPGRPCETPFAVAPVPL